MEDEDEIDVLGEFNLESLLTKNEEQITSCYDGEHQLGLHCDSQWVLDTTTQTCWYDNRSDPQTSLGGFSSTNVLESYDSNAWTDKERYLLEKGLELFGRSWSRLAQYIGTKNSSQVKSYVKAMGIGWTGKSSVSTSSLVVDNMDFNFTELIDDMEIPASMEEVIAAVSTAQPTVIVPPFQREIVPDPNSSLTRRSKSRRKKHCGKRSQLVIPKQKEVTQIYNAEEIKDVLTGNKEQDSIVLPNGEEVIRIRHGSSLSDGSDVDIDVDSNEDSMKEDLSIKEATQTINEEEPTDPAEPIYIIEEQVLQCKEDNVEGLPEVKTNDAFKLCLEDVEEEVSVTTDNFMAEIEASKTNLKETHIFKGDLITPSGKVMTVIVDDMSNSYSFSSHTDAQPMQSVVSKYMSSIQDRLDAVYRLPPPTQEVFIHPNVVTQEERLLHPEFFSKTHLGLARYTKIRNYIIDCWSNSKPNYVTKTSVRAGLKNCGDVNLISRIHAYLEQKGHINFGCEQCHYNGKSNPVSDPEEVPSGDQIACGSSSRVVMEVRPKGNSKGNAEKEKRESRRPRKKKLPFEEICKSHKLPSAKNAVRQRTNNFSSWKPRKKKNITRQECDGGYTMVHTESGEVIVQHIQSKSNRITTRGIKPVKLIHCKNYSVTNKAPYRVELEVSALLLVDVHSHLSPKCEVIGLLGGMHRTLDNVLCITTAVPCRTILSSNIHCDMCPVSQCESSELITNQGLSVVGWYHSHPNFDPSPSDTDVDTQNTLQSWFNEIGKPFVGLIISPYFPVHNVSSYRCCQVKMENSGPTPYQLEVKLINIYASMGFSLRQSMEAALKTLQSKESLKQLNAYKCLESVKHHLRKVSPKMDEEKTSQVLQEIRDFLKQVISKSSSLVI